MTQTKNKRQEEVKQQCLRSAKEHLCSPHLYDVEIGEERIGEGGVLYFHLAIIAKPNTGMLFLNNKSWFVAVGRKGGVRSTLLGKGRGMTVNKYKLFIA
jgi:hypothetical protein